MATSKETIAYILDQLSDVRSISARKMFGEYAVYADGRVVALVCDDTLFIKVTGKGKEFLGEEYREGAPYPGAKPWMEIDADKLEDRAWLCGLVRITAEHAPLPKQRTPKKSIHT